MNTKRNYSRLDRLLIEAEHALSSTLIAQPAARTEHPATNVADLQLSPEIVEAGVSGLLCDPHSAADIAEKICAVLKNPSLAESLGRNARARVEKDFDKRNWVKRNVEFYERVRAARK